jgi:hypothetical protein
MTFIVILFTLYIGPVLVAEAIHDYKVAHPAH